MSTSHVLRHFHPPEAAQFFHNAAWATRHSSRQNCIPGPHSTCRELQLGRVPKQVSMRISPSEFTYILYTYKIYTNVSAQKCRRRDCRTKASKLAVSIQHTTANHDVTTGTSVPSHWNTFSPNSESPGGDEVGTYDRCL